MFERTGSAVLLSLLLAGCESDDSTASAAESGIEQHFDRGPISVVVRVDKKQPTIADRIRLELEVTADEDYEAKLPVFGDKLDQFGIVDFNTTQPELVDGARTRQTRTYVLEPFLSGDYTIPPMIFTFKKGDEPDQELETEEIKIAVSSLLPENVAELQIRDIAGPVDLEGPGRAWLWWSIFGAVMFFAAYFVGMRWFLKRRKARAELVIKRPAHEIAIEALNELVAEDLPGKGEVKEFFSRISNILRHYIEDRFGIHAPGQTTEEFLFAQRSSDLFEPSHQQLLAQFLKYCDLVKFAEHQPASEDFQSTCDACRNFITETRVRVVARPESQPAAAA